MELRNRDWGQETNQKNRIGDRKWHQKMGLGSGMEPQNGIGDGERPRNQGLGTAPKTWIRTWGTAPKSGIGNGPKKRDCRAGVQDYFPKIGEPLIRQNVELGICDSPAKIRDLGIQDSEPPQIQDLGNRDFPCEKQDLGIWGFGTSLPKIRDCGSSTREQPPEIWDLELWDIPKIRDLGFRNPNPGIWGCGTHSPLKIRDLGTPPFHPSDLGI